YSHLNDSLRQVRRKLNRPLTLSEKILYSHLCDPLNQDIEPGKSFLNLTPDRVAIHDANASMALLQFINAGFDRTALPTTIHTDHLTMAEKGASEDLAAAKIRHEEVFEFLASASARYNIGFWKPGSGIIHTILFENYTFPGGLLVGTDSHTPNAAGMAMLGIGVGGSDAVDAMAGMPWELPCPKVLGVRLTGRLNGWASSKDIICKLAGLVSVGGGKGKIVEFFGPGVEKLGATSMATIGNMSAEIGATSCLFPYSDSMSQYLKATNRSDIADAASKNLNLLAADEGSALYYEDVVEINLDELEPHINGPYTPDLAHPLSKLGQAVRENSWPENLAASLVGSCTNSSYEDLMKVSGLLEQADRAGLKLKIPFFVSTGSEQIRATAEDAGFLEKMRKAGAVVLSSSCGPCVGQWHRTDVPKGEANSIISSFNRNFTGRHDGNPGTHSFVTSPELATAFAFSGSLSFNPATDSITNANGELFKFQHPKADELPLVFNKGEPLYQAPLPFAEAQQVDVVINPSSDRLQKLEPFEAWKNGNSLDLPILLKVKGKCTTDHISPAGPWYDYRGHLDNISNNLLTSATNAFLPDHMPGMAKHAVTGEIDATPVIARAYKNAGIRYCIIGHDNYGEGSSREVAALEPRYLGAVAIIANGFARIHEMNLKKQGLLPLTFAGPEAWGKIKDGDRVDILGVENIKQGEALTLVVTSKDGSRWETKVNHTFSEGQIPWLMKGSALNHVRSLKVL
ncbi:aconitase/homoaconitase, partial [Leptodontidium sp. 2 PMI_412]